LLIDPWRVKNYLRWMRTWLPNGIARLLGGRTTRTADGETQRA
jgi:hypothetical protein